MYYIYNTSILYMCVYLYIILQYLDNRRHSRDISIDTTPFFFFYQPGFVSMPWCKRFMYILSHSMMNTKN